MSLMLLVRGPLAMGILLMVIVRGTQLMLGIRHSGLGIRHSGPGIRLVLISRRLFSNRGSSGPMGIRLSRRLIHSRRGPLGIRSRRLISHRGSSGRLGIRLSRRLISHRGSSVPLGILHSHRQCMLVSRDRISRRGPLGIRLSRRLISQIRESKLAASNIQHQNQPGPGLEAVLLIPSLHRYRRLQFSTLGTR